jgi:hypothetical protein
MGKKGGTDHAHCISLKSVSHVQSRQCSANRGTHTHYSLRIYCSTSVKKIKKKKTDWKNSPKISLVTDE